MPAGRSELRVKAEATRVLAAERAMREADIVVAVVGVDVQ